MEQASELHKHALFSSQVMSALSDQFSVHCTYSLLLVSVCMSSKENNLPKTITNRTGHIAPVKHSKI